MVLQIRVPFRVLVTKVPYYIIGELRRDPTLEHYPQGSWQRSLIHVMIPLKDAVNRTLCHFLGSIEDHHKAPRLGCP